MLPRSAAAAAAPSAPPLPSPQEQQADAERVCGGVFEPYTPAWLVCAGSEPRHAVRTGVWEWEDGKRWRELPDLVWPALERARLEKRAITIELRPRPPGLSSRPNGRSVGGDGGSRGGASVSVPVGGATPRPPPPPTLSAPVPAASDCRWEVDPQKLTLTHASTRLQRQLRRNTVGRAIWEWEGETVEEAEAAAMAAAAATPRFGGYGGDGGHEERVRWHPFVPQVALQLEAVRERDERWVRYRVKPSSGWMCHSTGPLLLRHTIPSPSFQCLPLYEQR